MTTMPTDYALEAENLKRKQALALSLMQGSMQAPQGQMVSGHYVSPGLGGVLDPLLSAMLGKRIEEKAHTQAMDLQTRQNADLTTGVNKYLDTRDGKPAQYTLPQEQEGPSIPAAPSDPRRAAIEALTSNMPQLQQLGMNDISTMNKNTMTAKDFLGLAGYDPKSKLAAAMGGGMGQLQPEKKEHVVNNQIVTGTPDSGYKPVGYFGEKYGPTTYVNGEAVQFEANSNKAHQVANRPTQVTTNTTVKGESEFMKTLGKDTAEMVTSARKGKQAAQQMNYAADRLEKLNNEGVLSGPGAPVGVFLGGVAQSMGIPVDADKLARSEEYGAVTAQQVAKVLTNGSVGRSMTDEDRKRFEQQFPQLINTPQGRQQIIGMLRAASKQDIDYADQIESNLAKEHPEAASLFRLAPSGVGYPQPPATQPAAPTGAVRRYNPATGRIE